MDFDDLDDAEDEAGVAPDIADEVAAPAEAAAPETEGHRLADYLGPIPRNFRLPDFSELPDAIQKLLPEKDLHLKTREKVCIRAFVFYGAGDKWYEWAELAATAPPFVEVAVHEWPYHGSRDEEDHPLTLEAITNDAFRAVKSTMEQHRKGGRSEGAPFVFIGHSIGCLIVVALSKRLLEEFGLEPAAVVMLDRPAPHVPLHSEFGQKMRDESPWDFMRDYNEMVWRTASGTGGEKGDRMIKMWIDDVKIGSDTRPIGWHKFACDVLLLRAAENARIEEMKDSPDEAVRKKHAIRDKLMGSPPGYAMDCSPEQYEAWSEWCEEGNLTIKDIKTGHTQIKSNRHALDTIWELLAEKKALDPPKAN